MDMEKISILAVFAAYLIFLLSVGMFFYKRTEKASEYLLGGRGMNKWVTSLSAQASDMSGWLLMGLPGYAYVAGFEAGWIALGLALGTYLNWRFVAERLRKYTEIANDSITLPDYFENRFGGNNKLIRVVAALVILIFFLIYTASGFVAGGKLFNTVFGIPYTMALIIGALVVVSYTFLGGFKAVCWTDFVQGSIMFLAIIIVPFMAIVNMGGVGVFTQEVLMINPELFDPFTTVDGTVIPLLSLISLVAWGLGYFGQPHILVRFMAIRRYQEIKDARIIAMIWVAISLSAAVVIGLIGRVFLATTLEGGASETVFMLMVNEIFPPIIAGILLAAILSAIMSTADSQLLVTASAISEDFYKALLRKNATEKELVWISRFTVIAVSVLACIFAYNPDSKVLDLVAYAWAGFGAAFGPVILLSLFWKRMNGNGALAGMISGGLTVIVWKNISGGLFDLYEIVPGFLVAVVAIIVVSLLTKKPDNKILKDFEQATGK